MLRAKLTAAEHAALPEPLKEHYAAAGDGFALQTEGLVDAGQHAEFRETNRKLKRELEVLREQYTGIDPEEARRLKAEAEKNPKPPVKDDRELETLISRAVDPVAKRLKAVEEQRDALQRQTEEQTFTTTVSDTAKKLGVQDDYVVDVLARAKAAGFRLVDGEVRALKGEDPIRGDDGKEVTVEGFVKKLPAAFYGKTTGAGPQPGSGRQPGGKPGVRILVDPTPAEMGRLSKEIAKGEVEVRKSIQQAG